MPSIEISNLYFLNRYPQNSVGLFTFLLYLPLGIILLLLRVIVGIQVLVFGYILPDVPVVQKLLSKLLCATLGITIDVENLDKQENVQVYVSNYVTPFDQLVVHLQTGSVTPGKTFFNSLLSTAFGVRFFGLNSSTNFNNFKKSIATTITERTVPIHFQPESKQTNGRAILKFKTWPFGLCSQVQPVCIEVNRPFLDIKVSAFDSAYWTDTMIYLFSPCTNYKLRFLPTVAKMNLPESEFAEKVRQDIANGLKVELSEYSASDLLEWEKRIRDVLRREREEMQQRPSTSNVPTSNVEVQRMARQVKEVLPMVPFNTICTDLMKTWNVDQTITNILEGHVSYTPEIVPSSTSSSSSQPSVVNVTTSSSKHKATKQDPFCTAASSFGKSAQERMLSFQDRKQQLIESARQRYIEKHGLNIVGSS
ncbi:hypothetical protein ILUMI_22924 [Ignelater luminosus]|uniref:Lipid droplet-regulating VLDL assembly factor AUP1 n=1 Tax=Ignelater luminosus TaxID=2038154 RepID=A0A8K0C9R3_IGNLU|nr:hypothetical protein ILUMI_22924 [Ignelater luminosus]